ncbi:MAG TPA: XRE family transcriptional regulator [Candidatus Competibacteraceae bacterium]|jgi:transcriptional regulator with XRE-family HTH domain|uniref:helix-turn-helix domain-containing protein n=1 Tax=Candidatus Competibacter denitrificans TaxID=1400862 RepID=UPI0006616E5B|nr:helix-turn-helix transcriptional regulator [Candidatus Competibacter denitrificans]HAS87364.1 XRE family transcriptional regulator [Candidatus Competibacteraceae bacterium]HRC70563.1 helix-turn-helix transcriptional regulator [Candidatus Competibacter denitrificans]
MFGEALRLVRSFHQITQSDLSKALGISRSYLSEVESNRKSPSLDLLQQYAVYFNLPLSSLIFFSENIGESERDIKVKKILGQKIIAILQWVEHKSNLIEKA